MLQTVLICIHLLFEHKKNMKIIGSLDINLFVSNKNMFLTNLNTKLKIT